MLGGDLAVVQASVLDGVSFDPFSFQEDGLATSEVDVGRRQIGDALVVSQMVVQQSLITPTGLAFARSCIDGIRGLGFGLAFMGRSTRPVVLFSAAR
jgi:hypothetical protein